MKTAQDRGNSFCLTQITKGEDSLTGENNSERQDARDMEELS